MPNELVKHYIKASQTQLTQTETKILEYILKYWDNQIKGKDIAYDLKISQASISKFIKKINFESIHQLNLLKNFDDQQLIRYIIDNKSTYIHKTINNHQNIIIQNVVSEIESSKRIFVYGVGHSYICAYNFYQRFNKVGINVVLLRERNDINIKLGDMLNENSLVIIFTESSKTKEMINFSKFCYEYNIKYIVFTSDSTSLISKHALYTLTYSKNNIGFFLETIGPEEPIILLIDIIYLHIIMNDYPKALEYFENTDIYTRFS